ncbi:MAG: hypothetical protein K2G69_01215, partial [Muribaculaceae bacterium]|nr:hypothetical protein [Muribaculaceae bacterium]
MLMNKMAMAMGGLILPLAFTGCQSSESKDETIIDRPDIQIVDGKMTPEVLAAFGKIGEAVPSPDGSKIIFTLAYESIEENR